MLHAYPDRRSMAQYVIWSGDDKNSFYSSHRSTSVATNLGDTAFGPATHKKVKFFAVADCVVYRNRVIQEWLIRDSQYLVKQLGYDPVEVAKKFAQDLKFKLPPLQRNFGFSEGMEGEYVPPVYVSGSKGEFEIGDLILEMYNKVHGWKLFGAINDYYADNAVLHFVCNEDKLGLKEIRETLISFYSGFANAEVIVERVTCDHQSFQNHEWKNY